MDTSLMINSIGLIIDIIGAAIMFFNSQKVEYGSSFISNQRLQELSLKAKKKNKNASIGILLLLIGFILQLFAAWI